MMPLLRYFTYVGGALVALIFVGSYVIPEPATVPQHDAARPVIRIASDRIVPPRVDLDTSVQPTAPSSAQRVLALSAPQAPVRQAYAQLLSPPATPASTAAGPVKPLAKGEVRKAKIARRPDRQLVAAYPQAAYPHGYPQGFQPFRWTW